MSIAAILRMLRSASENMDPRAGMANLALRASAPGGVHPITKQRYIPGFEPRPEDIYEELDRLVRVPPPEATPEIDPNQLDLFAGPGRPYDRTLDLQNRLFTTPEQAFSAGAALDSPFPGARKLPDLDRPEPVPPPERHGFDFLDYTEGTPALTIEGVTYKDPRLQSEIELARIKEEAGGGMEGGEAAQIAATRMIEDAKNWQDLPRSPMLDRLASIDTSNPPPSLSSFLRGVRRNEFGAIATGRRDRIIREMNEARTHATDNPTSGNAEMGSSIALREGKSTVKPVRKVGSPSSPYPELLEALQAGAIRGGFMEELPAGWQVGSTVPLRLNANTATPVRIKAIHGYSPDAPSLERMQLMKLMGRGAQDFDRFSKPGSVVEFEVTDSAIVPKLKPGMEVGRVVPIERQNGTVHQMEILAIEDVKGGKKLLLRPVSGEDAETSRAGNLLALDTAAKNADQDSDAVNFYKWVSPQVGKFLQKSKLVPKNTSGNVGLAPRGKESPNPLVALASTPDFENAQVYGVYTKRNAKDTKAIYFSGTRAMPLDRSYRTWMVVQTGTSTHPIKPGTQGVDILQIDDAGFVTRTTIDADGSVKPRVSEEGKAERRTIESIFPKNAQERIIPFLDKGKFSRAQKSRKEWAARQQGRPAPGQPGRAVEQGATDEQLLAAAQQRKGGQYPVPAKKPVTGVRYDEEGTARIGNRDYVSLEKAPQGAAEERLRAAVIRRLGSKKPKITPNGPEPPDAPEINELIDAIDAGQPLSMSQLAMAEKMLPPDVFKVFFEDLQQPRFERAGQVGPAKSSMPGRGPREITDERSVADTRITKDEETGNIVREERKLQGEVVTKPTYKGKPTKQGLLEIKASRAPRERGLQIVDSITAKQARENPDTVFLTTTDTPGFPNLVNIRKEDLAEVLKGKRDVVLSKATLAKLTPQEREMVRSAIKDRGKLEKKTAKPVPRPRAQSEVPKKVEKDPVREARKARDKERIQSTLQWLESIRRQK